jgi:hypothetical protein
MLRPPRREGKDFLARRASSRFRKAGLPPTLALRTLGLLWPHMELT